MFEKFKKAVIKRKNWIRQITVASVAAGIAWFVGNRIINNGGLVAAIVCVLSIRVSLYKSIREGFGQIIGTAIGAGIALITVSIFHNGFLVIGLTVFISAVVARAIRLGEVASVNVPVTALIVIGPGISESNAQNRFGSTLIGALIAIFLSYFSHPKSPAGRTTDQIKRIGKRAAKLLATMSEGVAASYTQEEAGEWLEDGRKLVEEIPSLRSQSLETKRYARWSPLQEADLADELYLRSISIEHIVVQVRTISRILFDLSVLGEMNSDPNRDVAALISNASYAVDENSEISLGANFEVATAKIANDLRIFATNYATDLIGRSAQIDQESLIKKFEIISTVERIADSIDESSPALSEVATPDEPAMAKIIQVSPIEQVETLRLKAWRLIRTFLRR
jgi:uncharacterized membrane protein YgaE (UPF0421/DUF939 family)